MKWIIFIVVVLVAVVSLSFVPLWNTRVKSGYTKVNFWEKRQISTGELILD
jgi:FtsZ-interacting cell division protein ZipA